mgnify:FL=1|jgi:hypothetical protein|tara:strand:- start:216 stop:479 length:264 start_codon:yes stop_codon:yes gene_type:complete
MNDYFSNSENRKWFKIIDGLIVNNEDMFFNALYMAMTHHPTYVIAADLEDDKKDVILSAMLKYFENKEEFEKCASIYTIKKQINTTC